MKRLTVVATFLAMTAVANAQHPRIISPTRGASAAPPNAYRYGNILYPGGLPSHAQRLGSSISGYPPYTGIGPGIGRPGYPGYPGYPGRPGYPTGGRPQTVVVPYAVPVYYGDPYGYGYGQPQQQSPNVTVVVPQQPTPTVVINQNYASDTAKPELKEYGSAELPETSVRVFEAPKPEREEGQPISKAQVAPATRAVADAKPTIYLIALKDSTVRSALGFWVEKGTLHYVTPQGTINRVTLDMVDKAVSEQLNAERQLEFKLPG